jgi:glycosyltransferase involved in cell wall biosynthesis
VPFPDRLASRGEALSGAPAVAVLGGWLPNRDGAERFAREIWPHIHARCPGAVLHLFGASPRRRAIPSVVAHPAPADSGAVFAPGTILAVPLWIASGVRMKILEAWARGVPVVARPAAAAGLDAEDGRELLLAGDADGFARAIERLHQDRAFAAASVEAGRRHLREHHDPRVVAASLAGVYDSVAHRSS